MALNHAVTDDDITDDGQYVEQARTWLDGVWNSVAREWTP